MFFLRSNLFNETTGPSSPDFVPLLISFETSLTTVLDKEDSIAGYKTFTLSVSLSSSLGRNKE